MPGRCLQKVLMFSCIAGSLPAGNNALSCAFRPAPSGDSPSPCPPHGHTQRDFTLSMKGGKRQREPCFPKNPLRGGLKAKLGSSSKLSQV